ncbi:MAG: transcriptional regulator, MarR family, partial [Chloroflexi bacterium]|nr:transcriptional regulator, MarR family [Chloroflexota bacterium]
MTHRLDKLEHAGLVERLPDPEDRRALHVGLTPRGLALVDRAIEAHLANEERLISALGPEQRDTLASLLRTLVLAQNRQSEERSE